MRLQCLWCVHSSLTKIATTPIETCTSAGALHHTFYTSDRLDVILVITFFVSYMKMWLLLHLRVTKYAESANFLNI